MTFSSAARLRMKALPRSRSRLGVIRLPAELPRSGNSVLSANPGPVGVTRSSTHSEPMRSRFDYFHLSIPAPSGTCSTPLHLSASRQFSWTRCPPAPGPFP